MTDRELQDPPRLMEDLGTPPELRDALRRSAAIVPPFDASGGLARLEQSIQSGGSAAGTGGGGAGAAGAAGVAAVVVALAVIGGAVIWATSGGDTARAPDETAAETASATTVETRTETAPEPEAAPEVLPEPEVVPVPEVEVEPVPGARPSTTRRAAAAPSDEDALAAEMRELAEARRSLASDPAHALAILERGRREHGARSLFAEEREALSVLALAALDRDTEATRRGERFLSAHPESPHAERVRRAIEE
ncbi:hypothetical protein [Sandaracinus amylolyticus]|uniref:hypothetical protein n=1 Tax=Sandaracinus amylolyticus TaxID=927083 RepID=UPI001F3F003D|nr:hypothetical protein [Sandaracinus amylolyticus]UJR86207.1 Hypothetical protein I5071_82890 [Sandaracinus amylolyticus]